ncbi:MAG TPA: transcriptional regulator [Ruminococcaceae bacterium]|nr:transcriptional regulator [Oscillospiraceae bacterium]
MTVRNATRQRIINLCEAHNITINKLAVESGLTQSTLSSIINTGSRNPTLSTVAKICAGLNITVRAFFDDELFERIEQQIV